MRVATGEAVDLEVVKMMENLKQTINDRDTDEWEENQRSMRISKLMDVAGIPRRFMNVSLDSFKVTKDNEQAYNACVDFVENWGNGSGLAIFGNIGVGKTHLAISVCKELIIRYLVRAKYASVLRTFEQAKESFDNGYSNPLPQLRACEFLVLDDFGSNRPSPWVVEQILDLVDWRYSDDLPLMLTSNAGNWRGIHDMLCTGINVDVVSVDRVVDRLKCMVGEPYIIKGESWRNKV